MLMLSNNHDCPKIDIYFFAQTKRLTVTIALRKGLAKRLLLLDPVRVYERLIRRILLIRRQRHIIHLGQEQILSATIRISIVIEHLISCTLQKKILND